MRKWIKTLLFTTAFVLTSVSTIPAETTFDMAYAYSKEIPESLHVLQSFGISLRDRELINRYPSICPINPKDVSYISSVYGWRMHPIYHGKQFHRGIDYAARYGTPVIATGDGTVVGIKRWGGYGRQIMIDHYNGYRTRYAHLSKALVKVGDRVSRGDTIGHVGSTGLSTGDHLHYEIIHNNKSIDPMSILPDTLQIGEYLDYLQKLNDHAESSSDFLFNILNQTKGEENTEPTESYRPS